MAEQTTVIGRAARVRGRLTGEADVEVRGFVEGEIAVGGDVTVDVGGIVGASIRGRRIVVRGAVRGDLVADESILLDDGARVAGDVRAPRLAIAEGALVRGYLETSDSAVVAAASPPRGAGAARPAAAVSGRAATLSGARLTSPMSAPAPTRSGAKLDEATGTNANATGGPARRPPPPVVPALKKMRGQIVKKKER